GGWSTRRAICASAYPGEACPWTRVRGGHRFADKDMRKRMNQEAGVIESRDRLIVALDLPTVEAADAMVARLGEAVSFYKIGYQLAFAGGLPFAERLARAGKQVFLDLKLHDIGNTVAKGVESVARLGATFLTVHAYPQTMKAAADARG